MSKNILTSTGRTFENAFQDVHRLQFRRNESFIDEDSEKLIGLPQDAQEILA
jgi:hypothetical protein